MKHALNLYFIYKNWLDFYEKKYMIYFNMLEQIKKGILQERRYEFSIHAVDQSIIRKITLQEMHEAIECGEIIEDYPEDKYGPSCLIFGMTGKNRPLHIQCSYPSRPKIKIITVYEPDPEEWIDFKVRRSI